MHWASIDRNVRRALLDMLELKPADVAMFGPRGWLDICKADLGMPHSIAHSAAFIILGKGEYHDACVVSDWLNHS